MQREWIKGVIAAVTIAALTGCGGAGSGLRDKTSEAGDDLIGDGDLYYVQANATTPRDDFGDPCGSAEGMMTVGNYIVWGDTTDTLGRPLFMEGTIDEAGNIEATYDYGDIDLGVFEGTITELDGKGVWSDIYGCEGKWKAVRDPNIPGPSDDLD
jgi:hypothetical protein